MLAPSPSLTCGRRRRRETFVLRIVHAATGGWTSNQQVSGSSSAFRLPPHNGQQSQARDHGDKN